MLRVLPRAVRPALAGFVLLLVGLLGLGPGHAVAQPMTGAMPGQAAPSMAGMQDASEPAAAMTHAAEAPALPASGGTHERLPEGAAPPATAAVDLAGDHGQQAGRCCPDSPGTEASNRAAGGSPAILAEPPGTWPRPPAPGERTTSGTRLGRTTPTPPPWVRGISRT